ncbi:MAG TPA: DUF998 domain-containing protein [Candidatus Limnocylindrales bacterium]|nr:DUF998 domain-containing protein [Candidatus Limnocylindrales bacterium]
MRKLLWCGLIAGPLFVIVLLVAGALRSGFDPVRHPGSSLALGPGGWVQSANFVVAGLLTIAFAFSLGTHKAWTIAIWGIGLIGAGIFTADPVSGYPPGTPAIPVPTFSGRLHDLLSLAGFLAMAIAFFAFARGRGRVWAIYSVLSAIVFAGSLFLATQGFAQIEPWVGIAGLLQRVAVVTAWTWLGALAYSAVRHSS